MHVRPSLSIKVKAGALQFTIAFSLLVLMLVLSFLVFHELKGKELTNMRMHTRLMTDIRSAVLVMEESPQLFSQDSASFYLAAPAFSDSVGVTVKEWGLYHLVRLQSRFRHISRKKNFLFTDDIRKNKLRPSLYFSDPHRYLSLGGKTFLGNDSWLPAYGVRKAYVNGIGYYRDSLVHGRSHQAEDKLPALQEKLNDQYSRLLAGITGPDSIVDLAAISPADTVFNSFSNKRLIIRCPEEAVLEKITFRGNIVLWGKQIEIRNTVRIKTCLILAESVKIEDKFSGSGQFIAREVISAGDSCVFDAPTLFYAQSGSPAAGIHLGEGCLFRGDIILPQPHSEGTESLTVGEGTKMTGQVYCNGIVSLKGTLFGSLFCKGFVHRTTNGIYNNYLLNVCIDYGRLPKEYGGVTLTEKENGKKCMLEVF